MSDSNWALRDIGRAVTTVKLGTIKSASTEQKFNYQEFNLSSLGGSQGSKELKMFPAEKWTSHFESYTPLWENVQELDAYKLAVNVDPDAPKQTFIYGYFNQESAGPDLMVADINYAPANHEYVTPTTTGITPTTSVVSTTGEQSFAPIITDVGDVGVSPVQMEAMLSRDIPFIPSNIEHLANDATEYKKYIQSHGIKIHNIFIVIIVLSENMKLDYI